MLSNSYLNFSSTLGTSGYGVRDSSGAIQVKNSGGSWASILRGTITGTTDQVTVTNGDGLSGNPTLSLPQNIHTSATPTFGTVTVNADTYDSGWNGDNTVPRKDDIWDKIQYGEYTPTVTNVANVTSSSANAAQWTRIGDFITVYGRLTFDPTAAGYCRLNLTLPVSSNNFANSDQANGLANGEKGAATHGNLGIYAIASTKTVRVAGYVTYTDNTNHYYSFRYKVV
jgi:hypothetical protein